MSRPEPRAEGSANGKVILLGEHAVVHGTPALALGLHLGVRVTAEPSAGPAELRVDSWSLSAQVGDGTPTGAALGALIRELGVEATGVRLTGESDLPPRAGLGSSAAMAAAAARCLASFHGIEIDRERLFAAVQAAERVFHGNPSGLDATVAIGGGVLRFDRARGATALDAEAPDLVLAHSGAEGRTLETVAEFARRLGDGPDEGRQRLARIADLVEQGIRALEGGELPRLGQAMDECHEILSWFGVSTADLDRICEVARSAGALGAKLTGGGGGGCAVALVRAEARRPVARAIAAAGYRVLEP